MEIKEQTESILDLIHRDCQPFLDAIDGDISDYILYRGNKRIISTFEKVPARLADRKPIGTSAQKHDKINDYFLRKFGKKYRNGVYVTSSRHDTRYYGDAYVMVPIGKFSFLWSPMVNDMFISTLGLWPSDDELTQEQTDDLLSKLAYSNKNFKSAVKSRKEIMIWTEQYYLINIAHLSQLISV